MNTKYIRNMHSRIAVTCRKQKLLKDGDRILIGLSGGKDSLILVETLAELRKRLPETFKLYAIHVDITNIDYKTDIQYLEMFCNEKGVDFILKSLPIDIDQMNKKGKCFLCSWNRRRVIFETSKELNCNKIAFGHHMDDALETLFMNMIYHGSISSLPYRFSMFDGSIEVIRPLLEITNDDLGNFARFSGYQQQLKQCPDENTKRKETGKILNEISKQHKTAPKNIFRSMNNIYPEYLPKYFK